jgi:hypothetical protein
LKKGHNPIWKEGYPLLVLTNKVQCQGELQTLFQEFKKSWKPLVGMFIAGWNNLPNGRRNKSKKLKPMLNAN